MIKEVNYVYKLIYFSVLTQYLNMYLDGSTNVGLDKEVKYDV